MIDIKKTSTKGFSLGGSFYGVIYAYQSFAWCTVSCGNGNPIPSLLNVSYTIFIHVKIHIPVVFGLGPHTYLNIYTAGRQSSQSDKWSWSREDSFIGRNDSLQYSFYFFIIFSVFHSEYPFSAAHVLFAVIGDGIAAQSTVRYVNNSIVYRSQNGVENLNFFYCSAGTLSVDVVSYLEGLDTKMINPPAKLDRFPDNAIPIATPAEAKIAAKLVVSTPNLLMMANAKIRFRSMLSRLF